MPCYGRQAVSQADAAGRERCGGAAGVRAGCHVSRWRGTGVHVQRRRGDHHTQQHTPLHQGGCPSVAVCVCHSVCGYMYLLYACVICVCCVCLRVFECASVRLCASVVCASVCMPFCVWLCVPFVFVCGLRVSCVPLCACVVCASVCVCVRLLLCLWCVCVRAFAFVWSY